MKTAIFTKSYEGDFCWLDYALRSIKKFTSGFSEIVLAIPEGQTYQSENVKLVYIREPADCDHYLFQQAVKMYADELTDADHLLFLDSDTIFTMPATPETYFTDGRIDWMMTPYEATKTPWKSITEKFMDRMVQMEYMRRAPVLVPRELLGAVRNFCVQTHGMTLDRYIMSQPYRNYSEFNVLGAYAHDFMPGRFNWINTETTPESEWPVLTVRQHYSWGGLTDDIRARMEEILSGSTESRRAVHLSSAPTQNGADISPTVSGSSAPPAQNSHTASTASSAALTVNIDDATNLAARLKAMCRTHTDTRRIREILHDMGVIRLTYRYPKRKGWKRKRQSKTENKS